MSEEPSVHHVETAVHGRYLLEPPTGGEPRGLLVGFHGYGENAAAHMAAIRRIPGAEGWLLCAVQALHPFYTRAGEVVGSWMTREDRELAIADNRRYAAAVVRRLAAEQPAPRRLVFAGFSQGVAMAYRAAAASPIPCHGLIVLAGDVPPDVAADAPAPFPPVLLGRGTSDGWYDAGKMEQDLETLAALGAPVDACVFRGGHEWSDELYRAAGVFLERIAADGEPGSG